MANLFKKSAIKQKLEKYNIADLDDKLAIVNKWIISEKDGSLYKKTETQCEQAFNSDFFIKLLGYESFPTKPYSIDPKANTEIGAQKPDAILGIFGGATDTVTAVVEIKDANTPLDRPQQRTGNLTPIQQAFKYKPQFKNCRFVIATNFIEFRLFQDTELDYEIFKLKELADPTDNYYELRRFVMLLNAKNFVSVGRESKTEELLSEINVEQEKITNAFYKEYSNIRLNLMRNIWKNNKEKRNISFVADKSQKILDRIVFTCFCEDTGLLPDNALLSVFKLADASYSSVWDTLKGFFHSIDTGSVKLGIPDGYNGGLFHDDSDLDSLVISDDICKSLARIGNYDFENELTVNVLGNVFEQSITDLEEIKKKVEPDDVSHVSKRKKDGIFYTPEHIVDFIVQNSLGNYLRINEKRIFDECKLSEAKSDKIFKTRELKANQEYQEFLHNIKVVDPACGSGAVLVKVFDYLLEENRRVGIRIGGLFDQDHIYREILKNNIFGVDLNEESVRITQLSLWLKTAQRGRKLTYLDKNIRCGNSIILDRNIVGSKAFDWHSEFKEVFESGGFDVVVGNPPYVSYYSKQSQADKNTEREIDYYRSHYDFIIDKRVLGRFNTLMFFFELGIKLLKKDGVLGYIVDTNIHSNPSADIRSYICSNSSISIIVDELKAFRNVASSQLILCLTKRISESNLIHYKGFKDGKFLDLLTAPQTYISDDNDYTFKLPIGGDETRLVNRIKVFPKIVDIVGKSNFRTCITFTGKKNFFVISKPERSIDYPLLEGAQGVAGPYSQIYYDSYVRYDENLRDTLNAEYQALAKTENKRSPMVIGLGDLVRFKSPKLFIRLSDSRITATFTEEIVCADLSLYILTLPNLLADSEMLNIKYILAILNSKLITYYFRTNNLIKNLKTGTPQIRLSDLRNIPIPVVDKQIQNNCIDFVDKLLIISKSIARIKGLMKDNLRSEYNVEITSYDKYAILNLISKSQNSISLSRRDDLIRYLDDKFSELAKLSFEFDSIVEAVDRLIYKIYDLNESEISILDNYQL